MFSFSFSRLSLSDNSVSRMRWSSRVRSCVRLRVDISSAVSRLRRSSVESAIASWKAGSAPQMSSPSRPPAVAGRAAIVTEERECPPVKPSPPRNRRSRSEAWEGVGEDTCEEGIVTRIERTNGAHSQAPSSGSAMEVGGESRVVGTDTPRKERRHARIRARSRGRSRIRPVAWWGRVRRVRRGRRGRRRKRRGGRVRRRRRRRVGRVRVRECGCRGWIHARVRRRSGERCRAAGGRGVRAVRDVVIRPRRRRLHRLGG